MRCRRSGIATSSDAGGSGSAAPRPAAVAPGPDGETDGADAADGTAPPGTAGAKAAPEAAGAAPDAARAGPPAHSSAAHSSGRRTGKEDMATPRRDTPRERLCACGRAPLSAAAPDG